MDSIQYIISGLRIILTHDANRPTTYTYATGPSAGDVATVACKVGGIAQVVREMRLASFENGVEALASGDWSVATECLRAASNGTSKAVSGAFTALLAHVTQGMLAEIRNAA